MVRCLRLDSTNVHSEMKSQVQAIYLRCSYEKLEKECGKQNAEGGEASKGVSLGEVLDLT